MAVWRKQEIKTNLTLRLVNNNRFWRTKYKNTVTIPQFFNYKNEYVYGSYNIAVSTAEVTLTPRSSVLLQKLTVAQLVKKYPVFYGIQSFITKFITAGHQGLPRAS
jgi:hypothetical protein